jgi:hypothetical protein
VKRRRLNPYRAKIHLVYTVAEVARLLDRDRNTVRSWLKGGLRPVEGIYPTLILGSELRAFLIERRAKHRSPTPPGHIHCLKCKTHRAPAFDAAEYYPLTAATGNLEAICPVCTGMIRRIVSKAKLDAVQGNLTITFMQARARLCQRPESRVNHDSNPPSSTHAKAQSGKRSDQASVLPFPARSSWTQRRVG